MVADRIVRAGALHSAAGGRQGRLDHPRSTSPRPVSVSTTGCPRSTPGTRAISPRATAVSRPQPPRRLGGGTRGRDRAVPVPSLPGHGVRDMGPVPPRAEAAEPTARTRQRPPDQGPLTHRYRGKRTPARIQGRRRTTSPVAVTHGASLKVPRGQSAVLMSDPSGYRFHIAYIHRAEAGLVGTARQALDGVPVDTVTDLDRLRAAVPVVDVLGPASLACLD